ncbi:hypothetical protein H0H93_010217 [Arthromyces matolae]|nr:hypothetical protein H0H93_010217 [Arthromyces matolae]
MKTTIYDTLTGDLVPARPAACTGAVVNLDDPKRIIFNSADNVASAVSSNIVLMTSPSSREQHDKVQLVDHYSVSDYMRNRLLDRPVVHPKQSNALGENTERLEDRVAVWSPTCKQFESSKMKCDTSTAAQNDTSAALSISQPRRSLCHPTPFAQYLSPGASGVSEYNMDSRVEGIIALFDVGLVS